MREFLMKLFSSDFMGHGYCYLWQPGIIWLHAISDSIIALSYYVIPLTLVYFVRKRRDLPFHWMFLMFGIFIFSCGTTHLMEVWTLWHGTYRLAGVIKAITAVASVATAALFVHLVPEAVALPSPAQLRAANQELEREIQERRRAEQALQQAYDEVEDMVRARIAELAITNEQLQAEIVERKQVEEKLRRSESELRALIENVPAMVFIALPGPSNAFVSRGWREYTGLSAEDTAGLGWQGVLPPEDLQRHMEKWRVCSASGEPFEDETRFRRAADGEYRWFLVRAVPLRDEAGNILKWYGVLTDIEDRKRAEQELQRSEAYLAEAQKLTHTGSFASDGSSRKIFYWSEEDFRIWDFDPQQGPPIRDMVLQRIHPEDRDNVLEIVEKALQERREYFAEFRIVLPDGTVRHIHGVGHPVISASGEVIEVVGTHVDVTERKRAEEERDRLR